tara:strand:- start:5194 stop:6537 length:1344 start_codon:yes stop_codon:yes gene_type:complete
MHIDPQYARRSMFGSQVVHGINILLTALDLWSAESAEPFHISKMKVAFRKPLTINQEITFDFQVNDDKSIKIVGIHNGNLIIKVDLECSSDHKDFSFEDVNPKKENPMELEPAELEDFKDDFDLLLNPSFFEEMYPHLAKKAELDQMATLLATTRIVGMRCPGLRSVYSSLEVEFKDEILVNKKLEYHLRKFDKRFNLLTIEGGTNSANFKILAFHRPKPYSQDSIDIVKKHVKVEEFSDVKALIIGGSRGIGAISAKILAAGGADVSITYNRGEEEANQLIEECKKEGLNLRKLKYNVLTEYSEEEKVKLKEEGYTHLYYYATPFIFSGSKKNFSNELFEKFNDFYVSAFLRLFKAVYNPKLLSVLYPSTVALDEKPLEMKEYVLAKTAGEELCDFLSRMHKEIQFYVPRLPRLATDQTMSLAHVKNEDPLPEMLKHMRKSISSPD